MSICIRSPVSDHVCILRGGPDALHKYTRIRLHFSYQGFGFDVVGVDWTLLIGTCYATLRVLGLLLPASLPNRTPHQRIFLKCVSDAARRCIIMGRYHARNIALQKRPPILLDIFELVTHTES